eukprot:2144465-Rhodomonas_salina.3
MSRSSHVRPFSAHCTRASAWYQHSRRQYQSERVGDSGRGTAVPSTSDHSRNSRSSLPTHLYRAAPHQYRRFRRACVGDSGVCLVGRRPRDLPAQTLTLSTSMGARPAACVKRRSSDETSCSPRRNTTHTRHPPTHTSSSCTHVILLHTSSSCTHVILLHTRHHPTHTSSSYTH